MAETLARPTQVETATDIDGLAEATDKEIPTFTARELVLEKYANTPMAYRTKDGTLQVALGSAEAIMMCVFLQDEDMGAAYLEGHFRAAAELAAAQESEQDENKPDEKDVVIDDVAEADDSTSDDTKAETSDVSISSEQANITSDNANTTIEQINNPRQTLKPVVSTVSSSQNMATPKAPVNSTPARPIVAAEPNKPQLVPIEVETIDTVPEIDSEPTGENSRSDENIELDIVSPTNSESETDIMTTESVAQHNEPDTKLPTVDATVDDKPIDTEVTTESSEQIELHITLKSNDEPKQSNTQVQETPPILELYEQASLEDDDIIATDDQLYVDEPSSDSNEVGLELFDTTDEVVSAIEEDTVSPTDEDTEVLVLPAEELMPTTHETSNTKDKLYECVKAQIAQLPAEEASKITYEDYVVPKHIESAFIDLLEAYEVEDPELQLRIYIEQYGVSGLFDAIIEGTFVTKIVLQADHTESDTVMAKHLKLARFATHALTIPREQSFFHSSLGLSVAT